jgi:hypothetical protein
MANFNYETGWNDAMADCSLQYDALVAVSLISLAISAILLTVYVSAHPRLHSNNCYTRLRLARLGARLSH